MRKYSFLQSSCTIIVALFFVAFFLIAPSCENRTSVPWYLDSMQLWSDYHAAVADARIAEESEICYTLPAITAAGDNDKIEWMTENNAAFVLVGSMMSAADAYEFSQGGNAVLNESLLWVTLPYDLEEHLRRSPICADSLECRMRLLQLLGLPPDSNYDRLVFFYAECDRILRPSADPQIDDHEASLDFSDDVSPHYRQWFVENRSFSYDSDTPYPWTRLGYTYDWSREAESEVGPGEFLVQPGAQVRIKREVTVWTWYKQTIKYASSQLN